MFPAGPLPGTTGWGSSGQILEGAGRRPLSGVSGLPSALWGGSPVGHSVSPAPGSYSGPRRHPVGVPGQEGSLCPFTNCCRAAQEVATAS